jgi:hypothetical protein
VADTAFRRLRGLLGRRSLPPGQGMLLRPAFSIHTWFMHFPIDVVFLDPEQVVIKIAPSLAPFRTATCRGAREVIELSAGECERRGLGLGDRVAWAARATWEATGEPTSVLAGAVPARPQLGSALVVSADPRFTKLVRFLLEGRDIAVSVTSPESAARQLALEPVTAVVLDAGQDVAGGLRLANALRTESAASIVLARESDAPVPGDIPAFRKWDEADELVGEVARLAGAARSVENSQ